MIWAAIIAATIWAYLIAARGRFWRSGPSLAPVAPTRAPAPSVAIIVPARDEAQTIVAVARSLLSQQYGGDTHVLIVDDGSTDGTGTLARGIGHERLTVIEGVPRPPGWSGKLWAVAQGVAAAGDAPLLLLTDADIVHDPRHLATLVDHLLRHGLELTSEMVCLNRRSVAERALIPAFVFFFQLLFPFSRVNDPRRHTAAAAGGTILLDARSLARIGGIAAIRSALIDDVALAAAVKRAGRIWLGHGMLARSIRSYPHAADVWRMVARTAYTQLRHSPLLLAATVLGLGVIWLVPPAAAVFGHQGSRHLGLAAYVAGMLSYVPTLRRFGASPAWAVLLPMIAVFYAAATVGSAIAHHMGRGVIWKSRAYA